VELGATDSRDDDVEVRFWLRNGDKAVSKSETCGFEVLIGG